MDCLDRTNVVQSEVAKQVLARQLRDAGVLNGGEGVLDLPDFYFIFRNGGACSEWVKACLCGIALLCYLLF